MIEVMYLKDIEKIDDSKVKKYLHKRFQELNHVLSPQSEGYFLYVEDFNSLHINHRQHNFTLPSIAEGMLESIENVTVQDNIVEVSLLFNNEFMISLILHDLTLEQLALITSHDCKRRDGVKQPLFKDTSTGIAVEIAIAVICYAITCALKKK